MIGNGDAFEDYWGFVGEAHHDTLGSIVVRAVRAGFHVVLMQPNPEPVAMYWPVCTATDMAIKKGHVCVGALLNTAGVRDSSESLEFDTLAHDPERPAKTRPMVTSAIQRVTQRYGGVPNVGIDLHPSGYSHSSDPQGPATIDGPLQAWLVHGTAGRGGLQVVPPSIIRGEAVRCWGVPADVSQ